MEQIRRTSSPKRTNTGVVTANVPMVIVCSRSGWTPQIDPEGTADVENTSSEMEAVFLADADRSCWVEDDSTFCREDHGKLCEQNNRTSCEDSLSKWSKDVNSTDPWDGGVYGRGGSICLTTVNFEGPRESTPILNATANILPSCAGYIENSVCSGSKRIRDWERGTGAAKRPRHIRAEGGIPLLILELVLDGYIAWYQVQELAAVSKKWEGTVLDAKERLPDWTRIRRYLDKVNKLNTCLRCHKGVCTVELEDRCQCGSYETMIKSVRECTLLDPELVADLKSSQMITSFGPDPRRDALDPFESLSPYEQAKRLLKFHRDCVSNLLDCFRDCLTEGEKTDLSYPELSVLNQMEKYNHDAFHILANISIILMAKNELGQRIQDTFTGVFLGDKYNPYSDPNDYLHRWLQTMQHEILLLHKNPKHRQGESPNSRLPTFSARDIRNVGSSLTNVIGHRDEEADLLLGREIADSVNFMQTAREEILPRMQEFFPLKWMPCFGTREVQGT